MNKQLVVSIFAAILYSTICLGQQKPNIILIYADDISAREFPTYESSIWSPPHGAYKPGKINGANRAKTPMLDKLATKGAVIQTAWANAVCSPSRATIMTGRYAHLHKWWQNNDIGTYIDEKGNKKIWPLYKSSPRTIGHVAKQGGYRSLWVGKTQMKNSDLSQFGFDAVVTTPGHDLGKKGKNPYSDFILKRKSEGAKKGWVNIDSGEEVKGQSWNNASFFWQPSVGTWNWPIGSKSYEWWPNTKKDKKQYGTSTYGPDIEMEFSLTLIDKAVEEDKPFFIYHTSHLGHAAFNWIGQEEPLWYPGTPKIKWDGQKYEKTNPKITGDKGVYDTHGTITDPGIHHHIHYLDYQIWQYLQKLESLGIEDNTVILFLADNGTLAYGKMQKEKQRGPRVPFYIYMPGMKKKGMQAILSDVTDILPTLAELMEVQIPADYELNGKSLVPYLTGNEDTHRDWIYSFLFERQTIRGELVLRDMNGDWWDVSVEPEDLDSYPKITDWNMVSESHQLERDQLLKILPQFDKHATEHDAPVSSTK